MSFRQVQRVWAIAGLSPEEKLVLLALADHANDDGLCWPSNSKVAEMCGLTRESVYRILPRLEKYGVLSVQKEPGKVSKITLKTRDAESHLPETQNLTYQRCRISPTRDAESHPPETQSLTPINKELLNQSLEPVNEPVNNNSGAAAPDDVADDDKKKPASVGEIYEWLLNLFRMASPPSPSPIRAWLDWGADFDLDIQPAARLKKTALEANGRQLRSLEWLNDSIAASIRQRQAPMPETPPPRLAWEHPDVARQRMAKEVYEKMLERDKNDGKSSAIQ